ncbi:MAG: BMP family ABC transporter substrate-binding protein [Spirochaetes bacterium GWB1_66_5]|nr:MAG: BMP family ABC transporter substrate-binding protein [Spirochaetes bacterium GWB1_66_5]
MKRVLLLMTALLLVLSLSAGAAPKYKIGICFDVGGRGDQSFNDSAYNGLVLLAKQFKGFIKDDPSKVSFGQEIELKYLEPKSGGQDRELILRAMAEDGYNLIIGVGFLYSDSLAKVAGDFPDIHFGIIDGWIPDLNESSNVTCLGFAEHEGSFLMGAVSGLLAKKGTKVGFLGGMDIPLIHKFQGGFIAGAMYVNKDLRAPGMILGQYAGKDPTAFNDPKTGESIAVNFFKQGASIVYHASGGTGAGLFKAAKDLGKLAIGVDSDQGLIYATSKSAEEKKMSEFILTSMLKRVDNAVLLTGEELIETGKNLGGYKTFSLANDGVGYALNDYNKKKLQPIKAKLDSLKKQIVAGKITVPDDDAKVADWAKTAF